MNRLLSTLCLLLAFCAAYGQTSRVDSLTQLLNSAHTDAGKARVLLLRSRIAPPAWTVQQAMGDAQRALALYQEAGDEKGQVDAYLRISGLYSIQNNFQTALGVDSVALQLARRAEYAAGTGLAYGNLGRNFQALGVLDKARDLLIQGLQVLKGAGQEREMADVYSRLGVVQRRLGDFKASLQSYDEGILLAQKHRLEPLVAVLYMNKANSLNESARYDEAIQLHLESIRIKEKLQDERGLVQSFNNLANVYTASGQPAKALTYLRKVITMPGALREKASLGNTYNNLGNNYAQVNQPDSAAYFFKEALAVFSAGGVRPGMALVYHNLGNFYIDREQYEEGLQYLQQSLAIRRKSNARYEVASTLNNIGAALTRLKRHEEAEKYLLEALALAKDNNSSLETGIYKRLSDHYKATGDLEEAYAYQSKYISRKDSLLDEQEAMKMVQAQSAYEIEKRESALALKKKESEIQALALANRNRMLWFLGMGLGLLGLVLVLFIRGYRQKRQAALVLAAKNERIETLVRELHHRVKNNLQVVSGLLSLQGNRLEDGAAKDAMEEGRNRINAMSMIHQRLYMDEDLATVDMADYLQSLSESLATSFGYDSRHVQSAVRITEPHLPIDLAIPLGLIVNELVTNAFKHAFEDTYQPSVSILLERNREALELRVADNGKGQAGSPPPTRPVSFGMKLVQTLVEQVKGELRVDKSAGTAYTITISA